VKLIDFNELLSSWFVSSGDGEVYIYELDLRHASRNVDIQDLSVGTIPKNYPRMFDAPKRSIDNRVIEVFECKDLADGSGEFVTTNLLAT